MEGKVWRVGGFRIGAGEGTGGGEQPAQAHVCEPCTGERSDQGGIKKTVTPPERRDVARCLVQEQGLSVKRSCQAVSLSRAAYYREMRVPIDDVAIIEAFNTVV